MPDQLLDQSVTYYFLSLILAEPLATQSTANPTSIVIQVEFSRCLGLLIDNVLDLTEPVGLVGILQPISDNAFNFGSSVSFEELCEVGSL